MSIATAPFAIVDVPVVFGGTFDPIHHGHINAANAVSRLLGGVSVRMMLAARPRLRSGTSATTEHRWKMLQLACQGESNLLPDSSEMDVGGAASTIDTVEHLVDTTGHPVIWALGDDAAANLRRWVRYDDLKKKASMFVLKRTGVDLNTICRDFEMLDEPRQLAIRGGGIFVSTHKVLDISATSIRLRIRQCQGLNNWLHPDVYDYIIDKHLYTT